MWRIGVLFSHGSKRCTERSSIVTTKTAAAMSQTKISLFELAEAVGDVARDHRVHVERWDRDHPNEPLPSHNQWVVRARAFETAYLTLSLMALDEEASRKFVASLMGSPEAKLLVGMLTPVPKKVAEVEAA
jgi:hypothetical protein